MQFSMLSCYHVTLYKVNHVHILAFTRFADARITLRTERCLLYVLVMVWCELY